MTKKQNTELAVNANTTALAVPTDLMGGMAIDGDLGGSMLGRLALYQGTTQEQSMYDGCGFKPGDFIDTLEKRKVASANIVPVRAWVTYVNWPKDSSTPLYVLSDVMRVPPTDLVWNDGVPPAATKCINVVCLVQGEAWPYLVIFKKTGYKAGETLAALEKRRALANRGSGLYELGSTKAQNAQKQTYHQLTVRSVGDCPPDMYDALREARAKSEVLVAKAEQMATEGGGGGDGDDAKGVVI